MRVLVVGQGLAGTLASHAALNRGWDVHVIDAGFPSASSVAAGMYNPMSFRRIVEVWEAEVHLRTMKATYRSLEKLLGVQLLHDLPILKTLPNAEYANLWQERSQALDWIEGEDVRWPKQGTVHGGGWLNMPVLLHHWRQSLVTAGRFEQRAMSDADVEQHESGVWDAIIDCRGMSFKDDARFNALDIRANRGELLTIAVSETKVCPPRDAILNFGKWTIPISDGLWRLGASYEWNRLDLEQTPETRDVLIDKLKDIIGSTAGLSVMSHQVGLRPVARDRRPVVGAYPGKHRWFVFNGLGTRGVLIAPRWAELLVSIIDGQSHHSPETQPERLLLKA